MRWRAEAAALAALLALSGCGGRYAKTGLASWYGEELAGRPTASGERFDPAGFTAAHRRLPLGSVAQVTDLSTGRSILVRINDRGPYRHGRLIDLSRGSAQLLGTDRRAVAKVRVRAVSQGKPGTVIVQGRGETPVTAPVVAPGPTTGHYLVQVATFASHDRAMALAAQIAGVVVPAGALWRVQQGPFDFADAQQARDAAAARGYADAHLLATD